MPYDLLKKSMHCNASHVEEKVGDVIEWSTIWSLCDWKGVKAKILRHTDSDWFFNELQSAWLLYNILCNVILLTTFPSFIYLDRDISRYLDLDLDPDI